MNARPWTQTADGVALDVRVTPRSSREVIEGLARRADGHAVLKVRLCAAPVEGEANEALRRLLAKALGVAPRHVEIAAGSTGRLKRLRIAGDPNSLAAALERLTKGTG